MVMRVPEKFRVRRGDMATDATYGNNGAFYVPNRTKESDVPLSVIASDEGGWEHVSVSLPHRCPTWAEMCKVALLFWGAEDCVMQLHPPRSTWVNNHPYCLHLWRPVGVDIPLPPAWMVGYPERNVDKEVTG